LRAKLLSYLGSLAQDAVLTAPGADFVGALIFPNISACRRLVEESDAFSIGDLLMNPLVRCRFQSALNRFSSQSTGSSTRVVRALVLQEGPCMDQGEITDKGSINQKAILSNRAASVRELYQSQPPAEVIQVDLTAGGNN
jgi:feruloyl-CoA synthase